MEKLKELMNSNENANEVQSNLVQLINFCKEAKKHHKSVVSLPLPENELEKQNEWFNKKMETFDGFVEDVNVWLSDV